AARRRLRDRLSARAPAAGQALAPARPRGAPAQPARRRAGHGVRAANLNRYPHGRPQAAQWAVAEQNVAAMGAGDVAGNGKTEPGAAFVLIARVVEPQKRPEHLLAHAGRNPGTVVVHRDAQPAMIAMPGDRDRAREP